MVEKLKGRMAGLRESPKGGLELFSYLEKQLTAKELAKEREATVKISPDTLIYIMEK
jgi:hypothetical protein